MGVFRIMNVAGYVHPFTVPMVMWYINDGNVVYKCRKAADLPDTLAVGTPLCS